MPPKTHQETVSRIENETEPDYLLLGDAAEGSIGATKETHVRLDEFTSRISSGEYHVDTDVPLPCGCIDGRCGCWARPDAAGGTLTLAVADDLLRQQYVGDGSTADMLRSVMRSLSERGLPVGGHSDDKAAGELSGCGANDKLPQIYELLQRKSDTVRELAVGLGVEISDTDHEMIIAGAARRQSFSSGRDVLDVMRAEAPEQNVDTLVGSHREVVAVINLRHGTTLDRDAVAEEFGQDYQAFNVDVWAFEEAARALYPDTDDVALQQAVVAMVYYNLSTALTLCGPNMRVVVLN